MFKQGDKVLVLIADKKIKGIIQCKVFNDLYHVYFPHTGEIDRVSILNIESD